MGNTAHSFARDLHFGARRVHQCVCETEVGRDTDFVALHDLTLEAAGVPSSGAAIRPCWQYDLLLQDPVHLRRRQLPPP
jgi:hypothetical protein